MFNNNNTADKYPGMISSGDNNTPSPSIPAEPITIQSTSDSSPVITGNTCTKKNKRPFLYIGIAAIIACLTFFILYKTTDLFDSSTETTNYSIDDGSIIKQGAISVHFIYIWAAPDSWQLRIALTNRSNKDIDFDISKLYLAKDDGKKMQPITAIDKIPVEANETYADWVFPFSMDNLKIGDNLTVYYDDKEVCTIQAEGP